MDQPYKLIEETFRGNKITFAGRIDWLPVKMPRVTIPTSFDKYTLLFRDHSKFVTDHLITIDYNQRYGFNIKKPFDQPRPDGVEAVFTAFPRVIYRLETPGRFLPIYDLPFNEQFKKAVAECQTQQPADHGNISRGAPPQSLGKN